MAIFFHGFYAQTNVTTFMSGHLAIFFEKKIDIFFPNFGVARKKNLKIRLTQNVPKHEKFAPSLQFQIYIYVWRGSKIDDFMAKKPFLAKFGG